MVAPGKYKAVSIDPIVPAHKNKPLHKAAVR